jgi:transcriptional regulator
MLYTPAHFSIEDRAVALALMHAHPFATLVGGGADPVISHVPLVAEPEGEALRLRGHVARANPHWRSWKDGERLLAIFQGPDAYISPFLYEAREAVPTWNYALVHAQGPLTVLDSSEEKERVLKRLIARHDPPYHDRWNELDEGFRERMKAAIVAFVIDVDRIDAKFKLSQNRPAADRARVLEAMRTGSAKEIELARWMERLGIGS